MGGNLKTIELTLDPKLVDEHVDPFQLDEDKLSLSQLIPRIIFEKGSFLNLSEEALKKEIERESRQGTPDEVDPDDLMKDVDLIGESFDESETNTQSVSSINEQFFKNKTEVLSHVQAALNESSLSLDFVSLLISCVRPAAGTISMSAHLKKFVPPGSLNSDNVIQTISPQEKQDKYKEDKVIGQGWKLTSLDTSSVNLRDASARLSQEVMREKLFWDTIKTNFNNKEILYKTRDKNSGKRLFGVKYGYEDSGSNYKVRGNAILKPLDNGQIEFSPASGSISKKALRVRILTKRENEDDYTVTDESDADQILKADDSIRSQIEKARYFIFEEELFNQLLEEASNLLAYNITVENESKFSINLHNEIIEIEQIEPDEDIDSPSIETKAKKSDNKRADIIATYLRLMLTIKFKKNLESSKQPTIVKPPATTRLQIKPYSLILRPLIGQFRHEQKIQKLYESIKFLLKDIENSSFTLRRYSNLTKKKLESDPFKKISSPPTSTFKLNIFDSLKIVIVLDSFDFVNSITHVKAYYKDDLFGEEQKKVLDVSFEELKQIEECLEWLIQQYK